METAQFVDVELVKVSEEFFKDAASAVGFAVCRAIEPAEEVGRLVVEGIIDKMVHLPDVRITVLTDVDRSGTIKSECHENVAGFVAEIAHTRRIIPSSDLFFLMRRGIRVQDFVSLRCEKIAVGMSPEDFAADEVRRHLFAALG